MRRLASFWNAAALVCAAGASEGCGSDDTSTTPPPSGTTPSMPEGGLLDWAVDAPGPFRVGYRASKLTYEPGKGGAPTRQIVLSVWYPTLDTEGENPVYLNVFSDHDVFENATLAPPVDPSGYPVHVYSHGYSGFGATSSDMMRWFASHGWIAIAPDHTGNTLPDNAPSIPISIWFLRSLDVSAALDALESLPTTDPLAGKARTDRVLLSGHSFGAFTTWASGGATFDLDAIQAKCDAGDVFSEPCKPEEVAVFDSSLADPRVVAGLPMAGGDSDEPGWFGTDGYAAAGKPYMLMTGSADPVGAQNVWDRSGDLDLTWLEFVGGCHQLFALGGCPDFDEREGWNLVNTYALAFARRHVLGDDGERTLGILDGTIVLSPKIEYQHKP